MEAFEGNPDGYPFRPVDDSYRNRASYYLTMQANVMAEAVCAFHSGVGNVILQCKAARGALVAFPQVTDGRAQVEASDLQLKDNVVQLNLVFAFQVFFFNAFTLFWFPFPFALHPFFWNMQLKQSRSQEWCALLGKCEESQTENAVHLEGFALGSSLEMAQLGGVAG